METGPDPVRAPLGEPPVDRLPGRAEHRRKLPPRTARGSHEDHRRQNLTVTSPTTAPALRTPHLCGRHHPPEQHPQLVRHQPLNQIRHAQTNGRPRHKKRRLSACDCLSDGQADYPAKHRRHGMNVQVVTNLPGCLLWISPALPGQTHALPAARTHRIIRFRERQGASAELGVARLKSWRICHHACCSPNRMSPIDAAVLALKRQRRNSSPKTITREPSRWIKAE